MVQITITEALAEIKTIGKRIAKKREYIMPLLYRQLQVIDIIDAEGGSAEEIRRERQSIRDLELRIVKLRRAIQAAAVGTDVTVNGITRSIADWITWRREIVPGLQQELNQIRANLNSVRDRFRPQGITVGEAAQQRSDIVFNISEPELAREIDDLENTLGHLDGQLSLKNATVVIEV